MQTISPLDNRYAEAVTSLREIFSIERYTKICALIELKWLWTLNNIGIGDRIDSSVWNSIFNDLANTNVNELYKQVLEIEKQVNHDIKAVEIYINRIVSERFDNLITTHVHFGLTSEDITNLAYAQMVKKAHAVLRDALNDIALLLKEREHIWGRKPMLARTHGQTASPTTLGKEFGVFRYRLDQQMVWTPNITVKFGGATGNYNAMHIAYPKIDWPKHCKEFVNSFGFDYEQVTTQVSSHDWLADLFHHYLRINNIFIDMSQDIWQYMMLGYISLKTDRVGSSTMPHKVNPIEFEKAEGNLQLANAIQTFFADKLTKSRLQRDLSGSTVKRNLGIAFGYNLVGYKAIISGLKKIVSNDVVMQIDLESHREVITEAIQSILRVCGVQDAYDLTKRYSSPLDITGICDELLHREYPPQIIEKLSSIKSINYIGYAAELTDCE